MRYSISLLFLFVLAVGCSNPSCSATSDSPPTIPTPSASPQPPIADRLLQRRQRRGPDRPPTADTRTPAQLAEAACRAFDNSWRCLEKPSLRANASQQSVFPVSWTVPAWFIDPANSSGNASDFNNCTTALTPCATYQEISVHRWGCLGNPTACPRLRQDTTVTWISSDTRSLDPVYFTPAVEGAFVTLQGQETTVASPSITVVQVKNRATQHQLQVNLGASGAVGQLVRNVTHPSRAFAYSLVGGTTFVMTQPLNGSNLAVSEVDTWATTDTVHLITIPTIDLVEVNPTFTQFNGSTDFLQVNSLHSNDPNGPAIDQFIIAPYVVPSDCIFDRYVQITNAGETGYNVGWANIGMTGGIANAQRVGATSAAILYGGYLTTVNFTGLVAVSVVLDGGIILDTTATNIAFNNAIDVSFDDVNLNGNGVQFSGGCIQGVGIDPGGCSWGTGKINVGRTANLFYGGGTATQLFGNLTGGLTMLSGTTANSQTIAASVATIHTGITLNVTNLDAAASATGFGGFAFLLQGGVMQNITPN